MVMHALVWKLKMICINSSGLRSLKMDIYHHRARRLQRVSRRVRYRKTATVSGTIRSLQHRLTDEELVNQVDVYKNAFTVQSATAYIQGKPETTCATRSRVSSSQKAQMAGIGKSRAIDDVLGMIAKPCLQEAIMVQATVAVTAKSCLHRRICRKTKPVFAKCHMQHSRQRF